MACSRRALLGTLSLLFLSGCGFHLRGSFTLPFKTLYLDMDSNSKFTATLARMLRAGSNVTSYALRKTRQVATSFPTAPRAEPVNLNLR